MTDPDWLAMLREAQWRAGMPPLRQIAKDAGGISHTAVGDVLNGANRPTVRTLTAILEALKAPDAQEILDAYRADGPARARTPQARSRAAPRDPLLVLADAIDNLAAAIREAGNRP